MYANQTQLASQFGFHPNTICKMVAEMRQTGRYPPNSIIGERKRRRVKVEAFEDFLINRELLRSPIMKKHVKPYKEERK